MYQYPILTMCAANATIVTDDSGNKKFTKKRSTGRIDALVSLAMAVGSLTPEVEKEPIYQMITLGESSADGPITSDQAWHSF